MGAGRLLPLAGAGSRPGVVWSGWAWCEVTVGQQDTHVEPGDSPVSPTGSSLPATFAVSWAGLTVTLLVSTLQMSKFPCSPLLLCQNRMLL